MGETGTYLDDEEKQQGKAGGKGINNEGREGKGISAHRNGY